MTGLTTSKLAQAAGVNAETLRYYERRGLLPEPPRRESGYRMYPADSIDRLVFIKRAQELGFTLDEIQQLLDLRVDADATAADVRKQAQVKVAQIESKLAVLQQMRDSLLHLIEQCHGDGPTSDCPILDALSEHTEMLA